MKSTLAERITPLLRIKRLPHSGMQAFTTLSALTPGEQGKQTIESSVEYLKRKGMGLPDDKAAR